MATVTELEHTTLHWLVSSNAGTAPALFEHDWNRGNSWHVMYARRARRWLCFHHLHGRGSILLNVCFRAFVVIHLFICWITRISAHTCYLSLRHNFLLIPICMFQLKRRDKIEDFPRFWFHWFSLWGIFYGKYIQDGFRGIILQEFFLEGRLLKFNYVALKNINISNILLVSYMAWWEVALYKNYGAWW